MAEPNPTGNLWNGLQHYHLFFCLLIARMISAPIRDMKKAMYISNGKLQKNLKVYWNSDMNELNLHYNQLVDKNNELIQEVFEKEIMKTKAEIEALQSQVNPHFLYNALNTISCICDEDAGKASDLILTLASCYRQTLENDQYMLDIDTEINHVRTYLEIEKARFEEKLRVEINVEDGLSCQVPSFILQPIVENAVRYGNSADGVRRVEDLGKTGAERNRRGSGADRGQRPWKRF